MLPSHRAVGGHRKYVANLAELGADSSGKLCAEVDKDISGCMRADSTERPQLFYDSQYLLFGTSLGERRMGEQGAGPGKITCCSVTGRGGAFALTGVQDRHLFRVGNIGRCCTL